MKPSRPNNPSNLWNKWDDLKLRHKLRHPSQCSNWNISANVPTGTLRNVPVGTLDTFRSNVPVGTPARFVLMFQSEHSGVHLPACKSSQCSDWNIPTAEASKASPNVPTGTLGLVLHKYSRRAQHSDLAFEMRTALFCQQLWLLDNLWDASSLLPIRRAAWARPRLPST